MITFKQFLSEEEISDLVKLIQRDCKPFLEKTRKRGLLFRGVQGIIPENAAGEVDDPINEGKKILYWKKTVRKDRRSKDMDSGMHRVIDEWFEKKLGFKARSQSMFAFGQGVKQHLLIQYGKPCIVFPIGDFKYAWSTRTVDLFMMMQLDWRATNPSDVEDALAVLEKLAYTDGDLDAAIKKDHEIMIACDAYYAFPASAEEAIRAALDIY